MKSILRNEGHVSTLNCAVSLSISVCGAVAYSAGSISTRRMFVGMVSCLAWESGCLDLIFREFTLTARTVKTQLGPRQITRLSFSVGLIYLGQKDMMWSGNLRKKGNYVREVKWHNRKDEGDWVLLDCGKVQMAHKTLQVMIRTPKAII